MAAPEAPQQLSRLLKNIISLRVPLSPRFTVLLRGENLTNETIVTRNQGGSIDLGVPRTLWAGLRYGF